VIDSIEPSNLSKTFAELAPTETPAQKFDYRIFGIGVDRKHTLKWLFSQEKATLHGSQKVYVYSENALIAQNVSRFDTTRGKLGLPLELVGS
jgi:hypothetical protein